MKIDVEALRNACVAAKLPPPPDLTQFSPVTAQVIYDTLKTLTEAPSAAAYGRLAHLYRAVARDADDMLRAADCYEAAKRLEPDAFQWPYGLGKVFWDRGSTERADVEFGEAAKLNPGYAMIHWWQGQVDLSSKRAEKAKAHFERFLELRPDDAWGHTGVAAAHLLAEDHEAALAALQKAVSMRPNNRLAHALLSEVHARLGQAPRAEQERRIAASLPAEPGTLERDPLELAAWTGLPLDVVSVWIDSLQARGNPADAAVLCEAFLKDRPGDVELLTTLGTLYLQLGRADDAIAAARRALEVDPDGWPALRLLADCHVIKDETDEALAVVARAIKAHDKLAAAHAKRGVILLRKQRYDEGEAAFRRATELAPDNAGFWLILADTLLAQQKVPAAKECCRRALTLDSADPPSSPTSSGAYATLARALVTEGLVEEAIENFESALRINPNNAAALFNFGVLLARQGKKDEALARLRRAVEAQPANATYRTKLAEILVATGHDSDAIEHLLAAVQIMPDYVHAHYLLGVAHARSGDLAEAKKHHQQAIRIAPNAVEAYLGLSSIARLEKDRSLAVQYLREGLQEAPNAATLANALAWYLATDPDPGRRNGEEAVRWAEKACALVEHRNPTLLDTLAAAYAEARRFDDALKTQREAIDLATRSGRETGLDEYKARLVLYEAGSPYHEPE